ncbi:histidine kinase [Virgibacillus profundi]|uniref:histidine kinase n=1 Tax=Virgibacillus profundi TaxID=2024555 RepID=UPI0013FDF09F|nr:histidine kinase [Virgibacillus profundi]
MKKTGIFKKGTFQRYLTLISLVTAVIFMGLIGSIYYVKVSAFLEEKKHTSIDWKIEQMTAELQEKMQDAYNTAINLKTNENIITQLEELSNQGRSPVDQFDSAKELEHYLYSIKMNNSLIDNILVITPDTQFSSDSNYIDFSYNGIKLRDEVNDHYNFVSKGEAYNKIFLEDPVQNYQLRNSKLDDLNNKVFFGSNIELTGGRSHGTVLVFLKLNDLIEKSLNADQFALLDQHKNVIFNGDQFNSSMLKRLSELEELPDGIVIENKENEIHHMNIPFYNLKLFYVEDLSVHSIQRHYIWKVILISFLITILIAYMFSRKVSKTTLQPLYGLLAEIRDNHYTSHELQIGQSKSSKNVNLRERLFFYFLITILVPIILFMFLYFWQTSKVVLEEIQNSDYLEHKNNAHQLSQQLNEAKLTLARMTSDGYLLNDIMNNDEESLEGKLLTEKEYIVKDNLSINIYGEENRLLYANNSLFNAPLDEKFIREMKKSNNKISYDLQRDDFNNVTIRLGTELYTSANSSAGYITLYFNKEYLNSIYNDFNRSKSLNTSIITDGKMILSSGDPYKIGTEFKRDAEIFDGEPLNNDNYLFITDLNAFDWKLVTENSYEGIQREINRLFLSDSYLIFIILLVALVFSYWIPKKVIKPLENINTLFNTFDVNDSPTSVVETITGIDEIDLLQRNFNHNMQKMNQLINQTLDANKQRIKSEYEKREIQMNALQSQVNPHFLYNTLDNLLYIVESEETDKAVDMISSLSRFFRFITNREKFVITIQEEIAYTKAYIDIMSQRFDNFSCTWHVDERFYHYKTIKLILQPLIENAIHHGVKHTKDEVTIDITSQHIDDMLQIIVKDNAIGMNEEELKHVREVLNSRNLDKSGIYNVDARIKLYFGDKYGVDIESELGKGTKVTISLPILQND